jgi:hypothetical protein
MKNAPVRSQVSIPWLYNHQQTMQQLCPSLLLTKSHADEPIINRTPCELIRHHSVFI